MKFISSEFKLKKSEISLEFISFLRTFDKKI
jgi:hypothetical protein